MKDKDRIEMAADNCEVLRARLAKYEDAEGRPVEWDGKSLPYDWVAAQMLFDGPDYPEDFAYGPPRMMERLRGILDRYYATRFAPKVEPLDTKGSRKALGAMNAKLKAKVGRLERELAALKAQPSGVVPSALIEALKYYANGYHLLLADPDAWETCSGEPMNFLHDAAGTASVEDGSIAKAALESLNSSPVSAGDDQSDCAPWLTIAHTTCTDAGIPQGCITERMEALSQWVTDRLHDCTQVSAGGVDERAAFEAWMHTYDLPPILDGEVFDDPSYPDADCFGQFVYDDHSTQRCWAAWQARAALTASAPNHGERVREGFDADHACALLEDAMGLVVDQATFEQCRDGGSHVSKIALLLNELDVMLAAAPPSACKHRFMFFGNQPKRRCADCCAVEDAAPSAGSQGGDA